MPQCKYFTNLFPYISLAKNFSPSGIIKEKEVNIIIIDVRQPWTNCVNNGNKYLIIGAVVSSEYLNI